MVRSSCTLIGRAENCVVKDWIGLHFTIFCKRELQREKNAKITDTGLACGIRDYVTTREIISYWSSSSFSLTRKVMQSLKILHLTPFLVKIYAKIFHMRDFLKGNILRISFWKKILWSSIYDGPMGELRLSRGAIVNYIMQNIRTFLRSLRFYRHNNFFLKSFWWCL